MKAGDTASLILQAFFEFRDEVRGLADNPFLCRAILPHLRPPIVMDGYRSNLEQKFFENNSVDHPPL